MDAKKSLVYETFKSTISFRMLNGMLYITTTGELGPTQVIIPGSEIDGMLTSIGELVRMKEGDE